MLKYESREGEYDTIDSGGTGLLFKPELANGRLTLSPRLGHPPGRAGVSTSTGIPGTEVLCTR